VGDGNWAPNITLPKTATDGAKVTISSSASYNSTLDTSNTDFIAGGIPLPKVIL